MTAHLHLSLRLMSGAVPLLHIHAMTAFCRENLTFLLYVYITFCHSLSTSCYLKVQRYYVCCKVGMILLVKFIHTSMVLYLAEKSQPDTEICVCSQNMVQDPSFCTPDFTDSGVF